MLEFHVLYGGDLGFDTYRKNTLFIGSYYLTVNKINANNNTKSILDGLSTGADFEPKFGFDVNLFNGFNLAVA